MIRFKALAYAQNEHYILDNIIIIFVSSYFFPLSVAFCTHTPHTFCGQNSILHTQCFDERKIAPEEGCYTITLYLAETGGGFGTAGRGTGEAGAEAGGGAIAEAGAEVGCGVVGRWS